MVSGTADEQDGQAARRRRVRTAILVAVAALIAFPAGVWAADNFTDVPGTHPHHDAINAIADAGITSGCAPGQYCPGDPVTRGQMATFMDRLGALSGQDPVVNAKSAQNSLRVGGLTPGMLVGAGVEVRRGEANAPVITNWFNYVNSEAPTVSGGNGSYVVDLGFSNSNAFVVCTVNTNFIDTRDAICTANRTGDSGWRVRTFDVSENGTRAAEFWLLVYGSGSPEGPVPPGPGDDIIIFP